MPVPTGDSVRVALRIRPQIPREKLDMCRICTTVTPNEPQVVIGSGERSFTYDNVFDQMTEQSHVYATCAKDLVDGCFEGYNATVLAYGQTGSGKTYTMGTSFDLNIDPNVQGIIPRAVEHFFTSINERKKTYLEEGLPEPQFKITVQFIELYNEEVVDLLEDSKLKKSQIKIHEDNQGNIYTTGVSSRTVHSQAETVECLHSGSLQRTTACTNMNDTSSRSHAIFTISIQQQRVVRKPLVPAERDGGSDPDENSTSSDGDLNAPPDFESLTAKFHFVDLAGSERLKRTGATGDRAKEGISINCGLLALGNVISALGDVAKKALHVPYRDSKLTRLLQDSLGGNSRTLMIACISPSDCDFVETLNTLKYADRAKNIKNKVVVNQDKASKQISTLRGEIQRLELELTEFKQGKRALGTDGEEMVTDMYSENCLLNSELNTLRLRVKAMQDTIEQLKQRNVQLLAERQTSAMQKAMEGGGDGADEMESVITQYIDQVETLQSRLFESELTCEMLRKQVARFRTGNATGGDSSGMANGFSSFGFDATLPFSRQVSAMSYQNESSFNVDYTEPSMQAIDSDLDVTLVAEQRPNDLLMQAKANVSDMKNQLEDAKKINDLATTPDEVEEIVEDEFFDDKSDDLDETDTENDDSEKTKQKYQRDLADLQCEISIKERLIDELERSQEQMRQMRVHYEEKLELLSNKIKDTELERDRVLTAFERKSANQKEKTDNNAAATKIRSDYEKKLSEMKNQLKQVSAAKREHERAMQRANRQEAEMKRLKTDLSDMKKTKVDLMKRMKEDASRAKLVDAKRNKEFALMQREAQKKANRLRQMEVENRNKDMLLQRKQKEITTLRQTSKPKSAPKSRPTGAELAQSRIVVGNGEKSRRSKFSLKSARMRWSYIEKNIDSTVLQKEHLYHIESDMQRFFKQREDIGQRLQVARKRHDKLRDQLLENPSYDISQSLSEVQEEIDNLNSNLEYVQSKIQESEEQLVYVDDCKDDSSCKVGDPEKYFEECRDLEEARYMLKHLYSLCLRQSVSSSENQVKAKLLQAELDQSRTNNATVEQLLNEVIVRNPQAYGIESEMISSGESSTLGLHGQDPVSSAISGKARRKTATPDELLFPELNGNGHVFLSGLTTLAEDSLTEAPSSANDVATPIPLTNGSRTRDCSPAAERRPESSSGVESGSPDQNSQLRDALLQLQSDSARATELSPPPAVPPRPRATRSAAVTPALVSRVYDSALESSSSEDTGNESRGVFKNPLVPPPLIIEPSRFAEEAALPPMKMQFGNGRTLFTSQSSSRLPVAALPGDQQQRGMRRETTVTHDLRQSPVMRRRQADSMMTSSFQRSNPARATVAGVPDGFSLDNASYSTPTTPKTRSTFGFKNSSRPTSMICLDDSVRQKFDSRQVFQRLTDTTIDRSPTSTSGRIMNYEPQDSGLKSTCLECVSICSGHNKAVTCVDASDDLIVSGSKDRTVKIWSIEKGTEVNSLGKHPNNVTNVLLLQESNIVMSTSLYQVRLYDLRGNNTCIQTFSSNGLACDGLVDSKIQSRHNVLPQNESTINHIIMDPSRRYVLSAGHNSIKIWDIRKMQCVSKVSTQHLSQINCMTTQTGPGQNKFMVYTGSKDHTIKAIELPTKPTDGIYGVKSMFPQPHYDGIQAMVCRKNVLVSVSHDSLMKCWTLNPKTLLPGSKSVQWQAHRSSTVQSLCLLPFPNDNLVASGDRNGMIRVWHTNPSSDKPIHLGEVRAHRESVFALATNSQHLFSASGDKSIGIWKPQPDKLVSTC